MTTDFMLRAKEYFLGPTAEPEKRGRGAGGAAPEWIDPAASVLASYNDGMEHIAGRLDANARNIEIVGADPVTRDGFTQVPNFLFKDSGLSIGATVVYATFLLYTQHNDYFFLGQEKPVADIDVNDRSVRTWIKESQEAGLLEVPQRGLRKTNVHKLHVTVQRKGK